MAALCVVCVALPLANVLVLATGEDALAATPIQTHGIAGLMLWSLAWATGIGALAVLLAWPVAWALRGGRRGLAAMLWAPLLAPSYLAYHALGQLRAPDTVLGAIIERAAQAGWDRLPILVNRALAVTGLGIWVWPVAALALAQSFSRIDQTVLDAARLSGAGPWRRLVLIASMARTGIVLAWASASLLMLGSAVPLHLCDAPTLAVAAWRSVMLHPASVRAWVDCWPLQLVAGCAGAGLVRVLLREGAPTQIESSTPAVPRWCVRLAWGVALASTGLLALLHAAFLRSPRASTRSFFAVSGDALMQSAVLAIAAGALLAGLALVAWFSWISARGFSRSVLAWSSGVLLAWGLVPGILVGHAWALVALRWESFAPGWAWVLLAHLSRFAWAASLAGWWLARTEPAALRDARAVLSGASTVRAFIRTNLAWRWPTVAGVGLAGFCLSLHEIESTVCLQPPGTRSFAQTMLSNLHFARLDELAIGALAVAVPGMALSVFAGALLARGVRTPGHGSRNSGPF